MGQRRASGSDSRPLDLKSWTTAERSLCDPNLIPKVCTGEEGIAEKEVHCSVGTGGPCSLFVYTPPLLAMAAAQIPTIRLESGKDIPTVGLG